MSPPPGSGGAAPAVKLAGSDPKDWATSEPAWWCPGCGDYGVLAALQRALANLGKRQEETVIVSGIGCSGKISGYVKSYGYHSLLGRALPAAQAIKTANKDLTVIVAGGDGDGYGIGAGHFLHAVRRNVDVTYIVMDNQIYGLTKGQMSPTSQLGFVTGTSPHGTVETPVKPLATAIANGATFVAQGFSGDMKHLMGLLEAGIRHEGFSLINVFSPCVTYNKVNTYQWFRDKLVKMDGTEITHDPTDKIEAIRKSLADEVFYGLYYEENKRPPYHAVAQGLQEAPLRKLPVVGGYDYRKILEEFR